MKIRKYLYNDRGDMTVGVVFLILALNMLIAFVLLFTSVQIQCENIRGAVKLELNNLSAEIAKDTYKAMREGNLTQYEAICNSSAYRRELREHFKHNLSQHLAKTTDEYYIYNEEIQISRENNKMKFNYTCAIRFQVYMFGNQYPLGVQNISITGSHNTKF